jgi:hypothetical protein
MKYIIASLSLILAVNSADTWAQEEVKQYELATSPACFNNLGEAVEYRERTGGGLKVAAGMANRDSEGKPFIMRMNYVFSPKEFQRFIDRHECAHHQLGDIDRPHPPRNSPEHLMNESIADCIAIIRLRDEETFSKENLDAVSSAMRLDMTKIGFPEISISSRISNIENCFLRDGSFRDFIDIVKQRRKEQ